MQHKGSPQNRIEAKHEKEKGRVKNLSPPNSPNSPQSYNLQKYHQLGLPPFVQINGENKIKWANSQILQATLFSLSFYLPLPPHQSLTAIGGVWARPLQVGCVGRLPTWLLGVLLLAASHTPLDDMVRPRMILAFEFSHFFLKSLHISDRKKKEIEFLGNHLSPSYLQRGRVTRFNQIAFRRLDWTMTETFNLASPPSSAISYIKGLFRLDPITKI